MNVRTKRTYCTTAIYMVILQHMEDETRQEAREWGRVEGEGQGDSGGDMSGLVLHSSTCAT